VGIINNVLDDTKKNEIKNNFRDRCKKAGRGELPEEIWEYYSETV